MAYRDSYVSDHRRSSDDYSPRTGNYSREPDRDRGAPPKYRDRSDYRETDRDRDSRDRERPRDHGRDRAPMPPPAPPRIDTSTARQRSEHNTPGNPKPSPTTANPRREPAQQIAALFRDLGDLVIELAQIRQDEKALDLVSQRRERDFLKSQPKHAEYPSIAELQKRQAKSEEKQRDAVKERLGHKREAYEKLTNSLAALLLQALPIAEMKDRASKDVHKAETNAKSSELEAKLKSLQLDFKRLEDTLESTVSKQDEFAVILDTERENYVAAVNKVPDQDWADQVSGLKREIDELKLGQERDRADNISALRREITKIAEFEKTRGQDWADETSALKRENAELKSELASSKADVSALVIKVDGLAKVMTEQGSELQRLRIASDGQASALDSVNSKLGSQEQILAEFDVEIVDKVADFVAIDKPAMVEEAASLKADLGNLKTTVDSLLPLPQHLSSVQKAQNVIIERFGGMVDELRKACKSCEERITGIETTTRTTPISRTDDVPLREEKEKHEKLSRTLSTLNDRMENSIQGVKAEMDQKCDNLTQMVSTLDTQFNNLTTRDLFDQIIGQIENLFPNTRQLQQDLDHIVAKLRDFEQKLSGLTRDHNEVLGRLGAKDQADDMADIMAANEQLYTKKRKVDKTNGFIYTESGHNG